MAIVTDLVTVTTLEISPSVVYSSVWSKKVCSSMDIWRSSMDELHGRLLWTTLPFTGDFTDCGVIVHVDYPFLGDSWSKRLR